MRRALPLVAALLVACNGLGRDAAAPLSGAYALVPAESAIHFVGIKNNAVAVPGAFADLSGRFDAEARTADVAVGIASLGTGDPARDANITAHFFEVAKFPAARFRVTGLPAAAELPAPGASAVVQIAGTLELHGASLPLRLPVRVAREGADRLRVRNAAPLVLTAKDLGMEAQLAVLKAVCGHEALSGAVPVELDLLFARAAGS